MAKEYNPKQEVIDFLGRVLQGMQDEGRLAENLAQLSQGKVDNLEKAMLEINQGTNFGRAMYGVAEHVYYMDERKKSRLP